MDAFATFLLLSHIKLLNTSCGLLIYTNIYNDRGSFVGRVLYYDTTTKFFSLQHMPFTILAIQVLLVGILFPLLLLLLYPMQWFQKCLNNCHLNSPGLQIFMECFQGYYRDRTDGGWECRYFAAVYPALKIAMFLLYSTTLNNNMNVAFALLCVGCCGHNLLSTAIQEALCTIQQTRCCHDNFGASLHHMHHSN